MEGDRLQPVHRVGVAVEGSGKGNRAEARKLRRSDHAKKSRRDTM